MIEKKVENLPVYIYDTREEMGAAAAKDAAQRINEIIARRGEANVIFAAAPSQNELLENLLKYDIDWSKVRGFHQDEYIGIDETQPAGFGCFLGHDGAFAFIAITACTYYGDHLAFTFKYSVNGVQYVDEGIRSVCIIYNGGDAFGRTYRIKAPGYRLQSTEGNQYIFLFFAEQYSCTKYRQQV